MTDTDKQEDKTFTQAEVDTMLATAKADGAKEGQTAAHSHFQSVTDKAVNKMRSEYEGKLTQANSALGELQKARLEGMTPDERSAAMFEEIMGKMSGNGANNASDKSSTLDQNTRTQTDSNQAEVQRAAQQAEITQLRTKMGDALKDKYGIDPSKINWGDGLDDSAAMDVFMASTLDQVKAMTTAQGSDSDDPNQVNIQNSTGAKPVFDHKTADVSELIRSGAGTVRSNPDGSYREAPWLNK